MKRDRRFWRNVLAVSGAALVALGVWLLSPACCFIFVGLLIGGASIYGMVTDREVKQ